MNSSNVFSVAAAERPAPRAWGLLGAAASLAALWFHRARSRRALLMLDDRALRDIGLSRGDARREAERPFWR